MNDVSLLMAAFEKFDQANAEDPNKEILDGQSFSKELLYAQRMSERLGIFFPESSEVLQLAARAQHIQRWKIPRADYPLGRQGYKQWRLELAKFHAQTAADIMSDLGYQQDVIDRVGQLLQKKSLKRDAEVQTLEDVICLVFLEHYLVDFATKHSEERLIDIIQKTWKKMSEQGHSAALKLPLNESMLALVQKALQP